MGILVIFLHPISVERSRTEAWICEGLADPYQLSEVEFRCCIRSSNLCRSILIRAFTSADFRGVRILSYVLGHYANLCTFLWMLKERTLILAGGKLLVHKPIVILAKDMKA